MRTQTSVHGRMGGGTKLGRHKHGSQTGVTGWRARGGEIACSIILIKVRDRLMKKCHADVNFWFLQGDVDVAYSRGGAGRL